MGPNVLVKALEEIATLAEREVLPEYLEKQAAGQYVPREIRSQIEAYHDAREIALKAIKAYRGDNDS